MNTNLPLRNRISAISLLKLMVLKQMDTDRTYHVHEINLFNSLCAGFSLTKSQMRSIVKMLEREGLVHVTRAGLAIRTVRISSQGKKFLEKHNGDDVA